MLPLRGARPGGSVALPLVTGFGAFAEGGLAWCEDGGVVDLRGLGGVFAAPSLNPLMAAGPAAWAEAVAAARSHDGPRADGAAMRLPFDVADYVDLNASIEHAANVGRILRPGQEAPRPNWLAMPVGYHGRAGTVVVSGTDVVRPSGQLGPGAFGPTRKLDVELELGFVVGGGAVFGVVLLNDWSARDIQAWETVPLGPFLGKSFQTSISAWVTPLSLLEPRRVQAREQDPPPLPYLSGGRDWALDLDVSIEIDGEVVSRGNARTLYWTMPQMLAHLTSNGAALRTGDLVGTGTISGAEPGSEGSLLELYGNERYLADGQEVVLRAEMLGEVRGRVRPAV
jgi:fumarylacetoacetase